MVRLLNYFAWAAAAAGLLGGPVTVHAGPKPLMVHYLPWFQSPYSLGATNWGFHWTMNHVNPNLTDPQTGRRQIASWYYPLIGPYDTSDPAVLEYHMLLMKLAGIDGVIVDWYGADNYYDYLVNDQRALAVCDYAGKAGLLFSLCYEDATIGAEISGGCKNDVCLNSNNALAHAQGELLYAQTNYFARAHFLRWHGQPVLLNFGPQYFLSSAEWESVFSPLDASNRPAFFTENARVSPAATGAFDWPPMYLSRTNAQSAGQRVLSGVDLGRYLADFDAGAGGWPAYVSTAFPRFHDYYAAAGVSPSFGYLDEQGGRTFHDTLERAMTNGSAIVQIATWNDYGEGTVIEPALTQAGSPAAGAFTDLGIVQDMRRQHVDPGFPYHTNDLALALRFYHLRAQYAGNAYVNAEMDRIFTNLVSGSLAAARVQLAGLESARPVIDNVSTNSSRLEISIGGYLAAGARIEESTNLATWQTVETFAAGTNQMVFNTDMAAPVCRFIKVE